MDQANLPNPLNMGELLNRYLDRQISAQADGLGFADLGPAGDAFPHDTTPIQPVDPALAWKDATAVADLLAVGKHTWKVPTDWPAVVMQQEPAIALSFSLGNYPQLVRNLQPLLSGEPLAWRARLSEREPMRLPNLVAWARGVQGESQRLLAAGVMRMLHQFEVAAELLLAEVSPELKLLRDNELAALAWQQGRAEKALALWQQMPDSPAVRFNRGMAKLFAGLHGEAIAELTAAVAALPETSAWHHLASLYLTMAEMRQA